MTGEKYINSIFNAFYAVYFLGAAVRIIVIGMSMISGNDEGKGPKRIITVLKATVIVVVVIALIETLRKYYE